MHPAILLLEFESIAIGIVAGDAMAKRAGLATLHTGSVQPGKYLVLAGGEVGHVEEARMAGREYGKDALIGEIYLPEVHPAVVEAVTGARRPALGKHSGWWKPDRGLCDRRGGCRDQSCRGCDSPDLHGGWPWRQRVRSVLRGGPQRAGSSGSRSREPGFGRASRGAGRHSSDSRRDARQPPRRCRISWTEPGPISLETLI